MCPPSAICGSFLDEYVKCTDGPGFVTDLPPITSILLDMWVGSDDGGDNETGSTSVPTDADVDDFCNRKCREEENSEQAENMNACCDEEYQECCCDYT